MYGLYLGRRLAQRHGIQVLVILGDSYLIIQFLRSGIPPKDNTISLLFHRIKSILPSFSNSSIFHILWNINPKVDLQANNAYLLGEGQVEINGSKYFVPIP